MPDCESNQQDIMGSQRSMRIGMKHSGAMRSLIGGKASGEPVMRTGGKNNS